MHWIHPPPEILNSDTPGSSDVVVAAKPTPGGELSLDLSHCL